MASRSLYEHATANAALARYHAQAMRLLSYQRFFESALPPPLRKHARIANMRAGKLVVYAGNAAVATKIRQLAGRIADFFVSKGVDVSEIDVRVQAGIDAAISQHTDPRSATKPLPSAQRIESLEQLAGTLPEDDPLKSAVLSLARTLRAR